MGQRTPAEPRFWAMVNKAEDCWEWTGHISPYGYGRFRPYAESPSFQAHRYAYLNLRGPIPDGLVLDHLCRNRACVNPDHLEPVTNTENVRRGEGFMAKQMRKTHCIRGHELPAPNHRGRRACRQCEHIHSVQRWAKHKEGRTSC